MTNNSLSIHVESGDIFYNDFNTKENFYNFLLAQQDESKQFIPRRISYHYSFETRSYLPSFSPEEIDKFDVLSYKNAKYLFCKFNDWIESMGEEKTLIRHTSKVKDEIGPEKIGEKDKQFVIEKIIAGIEKKRPYTIETEKKPEIMLEILKNYRICRSAYQSLFFEVAETFVQYTNTLSLDEIKQLDDDLKANGWRVKPILKIEDYIELLNLFQLFYYFNGRPPLTNGLLLIPDGETPDSSEKISIKTLYEMFKDTKSHGLVSLQFLLALNINFGEDVSLSKDTITELYKNLSFRPLSGGQQIEFEKMSDLTAHINFKMKHSILSNLDDQDLAAKKKMKMLRKHEFFKKSSDEDNFEESIIEDLINNEPYKYKKIEDPYVKPTVKDAVTIKNETNKEIDDFLKVASEFNKIDKAATRQKKVDYYDKLFEDVQEIDDCRQKIEDASKQKIYLLMMNCLVAATKKM